MANLVDSGERVQFDTGAVRDIQEGKGRCDLLPLDVVGMFLDGADRHRLLEIELFKLTGIINHLIKALSHFMINTYSQMEPEALLEVSKHFEDGAIKYGDNNWQKGIPVKCYINSAVRHYLKWLAKYDDERHDLAFMWNLICAIWTCDHMPELNDYGKGETTEYN